MMKYIKPDSAQGLIFAETNVPEPTQGQLLVKVAAIGVNRADLLQAAGHYPPPPGDSEILGLEMAGEVVALGQGVDESWLGQNVMGLCSGGAYAEYVAIDVRHVMLLPDTLNCEQGAAVCETFLTAFDALFHLGSLKSGQTALVHAGASGVGSAAIKLVKQIGGRVVVTAGSDEKCAFAERLGADLAINYRENDWAEVMESKQMAANVIVDPVAGRYLNMNMRVAAMDCHIIVLALLGGRYTEQFDGARLLKKRISLHGSTLRNRTPQYKTRLVKAFYDAFYTSLSDSTLLPELDSVFDWSDADQAHERLRNNANLGKVVMRVSASPDLQILQ